MSPRIKWGLITGGVVALLNLCGGALIGAFNNCVSIITVIIAASVAGYLCGQQEPSGERVKAGGIAGAIVGAISLVSQLIGGISGGLISSGIVASFSPQVSSYPSSFTKGMGAGLGIIIGVAIIVGFMLVLAGAGVGALVARLSAPKIPEEIRTTPNNI